MVTSGRVALNIADMTYLGSAFGILASGFMSTSSPVVDVEKGRVDGLACVCDGEGAQDPDRLQAFVDFVRDTMGPKAGMRYRFRVYEEGPKGGWRKLK